jgi:SAM-dependent methyltransferase
MGEEVERLRAFVETRAQAQENLIRALLLESATRAAEALEGRIQLAAAEAIAYAEQGLERHEAALGAFGRRLAELSREPPPPEPAAPPAADVGEYLVGAAAGWPQCRRLPLRDESEAAFLADLAALPIPPGGASRLVAAHVVEYAPAAALADRLLPHWRSRLAPGGELVVVTLDGPAWAADLARHGDFATLRERLALDGAGRPLRRLFDAAGLAETLRAAGFAPGPAQAVAPLAMQIVAK